MDVGESVATENVTSYGNDVYSANVSNATPDFTGSATGFARDSAASTNPGFGSNTNNVGGAGTITVATGTTLAGNLIISNLRLTGSRIRGAVGLAYNFLNSGDITTTWSTGS
jgi:hypothetical protein